MNRKSNNAASQRGLPRTGSYMKHIQCAALAAITGQTKQAIARQRYPGDTILRAAVGGATSDGTGAELVSDVGLPQEQFTNSVNLQTPFDHPAVKPLRIQVPFLTNLAGANAEPTAASIAPAEAIPVSVGTFAAREIAPARRAVLTVLSQPLFELPDPLPILTRSTQRPLIREVNSAAWDPTRAGSLTSGAFEKVAGGSTAVDVDWDLQELLEEGATSANAKFLVWIGSPVTTRGLTGLRTAFGNFAYPDLSVREGGQLLGLPYVVADGMPDDVLVLVDASELFLARGLVDIKVSQDASLVMVDDPSMDAGDGTGATTVSMFQTHSVALIVAQTVNWAMRRADCVAFLSSFDPRSGISTA